MGVRGLEAVQPTIVGLTAATLHMNEWVTYPL